MFGISGFEFLVIALVGLMVIGPKEIPAVIKTVRGLAKKCNDWKKACMDTVNEMLEEEDGVSLKKEADRINQEVRQIIDLEGIPRDAYDVSEIEDTSRKRMKR